MIKSHYEGLNANYIPSSMQVQDSKNEHYSVQ